jgi:hypothetical protein
MSFTNQIPIQGNFFEIHDFQSQEPNEGSKLKQSFLGVDSKSRGSGSKSKNQYFEEYLAHWK